jgi:hypothetical protein
MLSTRLTTTDNGLLCNKLNNILNGVTPLIERRTANNKRFGKLEITVPRVSEQDDKNEPLNIIAGFLLDTSGSMQGYKLQHAINTIKKFVEVIHSERNGKTIEHQPIHSWIYLITFNSYAELIIPFQEITDETIPLINEHLDHIRTAGSTNYQKAFEKQTEVIEDIIKKLNDPQPPESVAGGRNPQQPSVAGGRNPQHYHLIRFFETDGEITEGSSSIEKLYEMMRCTSTTPWAAAATTTGHRITFEDYILGYTTDIDLKCLKILASPYSPAAAATQQPPESVAGGRNPQQPPESVAGGRNPHHCSSLVTIIKPEDIGWQVGEILFKLIMRYGTKVQVSVSTASPGDATAELFEYQTHQWGSETTLHSMIHGEKKALWIQYTPSASVETTTPLLPPIQVKIHYENQFTGESFTYQFEHEVQPSTSTIVTGSAAPATVNDDGIFETVPTVIPIILGMIQIEIFKQFREIEANRYDKDTIVREAYKTLRMLRSIDGVTRLSYPAIACQTLNLMTDVKVIIGLTTIQNYREQNIILHARRICSAEQEVFNSGATISRKYVDDEEEYEDEAIRVINEAKAAAAATNAAIPEEYVDDYDDGYGRTCDDLPSRIPTVMYTQPTADDFMDTPCVPHHHHHSKNCGSEIRALCVRIATAKKNKEDITTEELYQQIKYPWKYSRGGGYDPEYDAPICRDNDDTFSSTPMNDDYTQRRMGMMRQMSS